MTEPLSRRHLLHATLLAPAAAIASPPAPQHATPPSRQDRLRLDARRLDTTLRGFVAQGRAVGVSALVWQDGATRYFGAAGHADRETQRPMTRETPVRIWSMTKPIAAFALMRLWEAGRFRLDDPLALHLPEFERMRVHADDGRGERPAQRSILVRDLLRHTAGLTYGMSDGPADRAFRAADPFAKSRDLAAFTRAVAALPLRSEPGTEWHYSTAVDVQSRLVEVLAGEPFDVHVQRQVLQPLGMTRTGWQAPADAPRIATTYFHAEDGTVRREPEPPQGFATGGFGLIAPIDDYLRFARCLLGEGQLDGVRLLQPATVRLMMTDQLDPAITHRHFLPEKGQMGFGLGGAVRVAPPASADEARGSVGEYYWDGMASTLFWVDPAHALAVVFFTQKLPYDFSLHRELRRAVYGG